MLTLGVVEPGINLYFSPFVEMVPMAMHNNFISVVSVLNSAAQLPDLPEFLRNVHGVLSRNFADFEIILINNALEMPPDVKIEPLDADLKRHISLLNLSRRTNRNHAVLAGLDRSNGDYTVILETEFYHNPDVITELFDKTLEGFDIVYLRAKTRHVRLRFRLLYKVFYYILKRYSALRIDDKAHNTRIISRRALNSLLRLRENLRFMKPIYAIVGYRTAHVDTEVPLHEEAEKFSERFRTSLIAITSYTTFLRTLLLWIFLFSFIFLIGVVVNALKVKFSGIDIFGNLSEATTGWTFLVILISVFFAITCLNLYIMSIYLSNIYNEIKQRPLYIIESVKRF